VFLSDRYGPQFMIWRVEQRGLGEKMILAADGKMMCLGYASFVDRLPSMQEWLQPFEDDLEHLDDGGRKRLTGQHLLLRVVQRLDDKQKRYPAALREA
jgi:hypothetical protein